MIEYNQDPPYEEEPEKPKGPPPPPPIGGIVLVDKPASKRIKSMTVVRSVKRRLIAGGCHKSIKVGHAGTLDPLASGLLIVLVGRGTRWCERLMAREKEYVATIDLSRSSPTDDLEAPTEPNPEPAALPTRESIERILQEQFTGVIQQRPPDFSAIFIDGKRAYDLARAGKATDLKPRPIIMHDARVETFEWPLLTFWVRCGKGTYIRSLARDIGIAVTGSAAVLTELRRTGIGHYRVEAAQELDALPPVMTPEHLLPLPKDDAAVSQ
jgi:tRNA pseudouridine55 synthase